MKILILYTRLPGYWLASMNAFIKKYKGEFVVIAKKENPDAPFNFEDQKGISIYDREKFTESSLLSFCKSEQPDIVYVTGWTDKSYLTIADYFKDKNIPVICGGVDNKWENTLRQNIGSIYFKLFLRNRFTHIWIPGEPQQEFARHLGFTSNEILTGLYSADLDLFLRKNRSDTKHEFSKRFLFVGRYVEEKGIKELWKAFMEFSKKSDSNWELHCFGDGPLMDSAPSHPFIKHHGFVQPAKLRELAAPPGVFILPSKKEPWGVVLHEFAACGFPIICSSEVGAATAFLEEGDNGFGFKAGNYSELLNCMEKIAKKSDAEFSRMSRKSISLAEKITPEGWADTLKALVDQY